MTNDERRVWVEEAVEQRMSRLGAMPPRPVVTELWRARVALCDLLQGQRLRSYARREFDAALDMEALGAPPEAVTQGLAGAAHWEWMAVRCELGQILWGCRYDRQGRCPEDFDPR